NSPLNQINAKQIANRLYEKEGYDDFTFPTKGMQGINDGLEKNIVDKGGEINIGASTTNLDFDKNEMDFVDAQKKEHKTRFDYFINTIPVPELIKFAKGLPESYVADIKKLRYTPVVGLAFATEDFLDSRHYWINLFNERVHVIYQHSLIIDKYNSKITWCVRYGGSAEDMNKSDSEIKELYLNVLKKYFPNMKLKWCLVFRENYAEPIYDKDYSKYAPTYKTPLKQLYMAGIQVTFPKIRNMNVALESGEKVAEYIIKDLHDYLRLMTLEFIEKKFPRGR
ncbi:MAG: FAD-dependent oxidoreductase, partial [Nanoarchaeota archaeon]